MKKLKSQWGKQMTETEKAIRDFCGHHADWWPSTTQVQEMLALAQPAQESLEYWNAVEGWVKIDEVRQHFDSVGCGTIYKTSGEDRVPIYTTPPQRPSRSDIKPLTDEQTIILKGTTCPEIDWKARHGVEMNNGERNKWMLDWFMAFKVAIEAAHGIKENT